MEDGGQNWRGRASERSPLIPGGFPTTPHYGGPQDLRAVPPAYSSIPNDPGREYQGTRVYHHQRDSSPIHRARITGGMIGCSTIILLILVPYLMLDIYLFDLPTKITRWREETGQMRKQEIAMRKEEKYLANERIALRRESTRLEKERIAYDSSSLRMEGERQALESVIRHLEQEESTLEKKKQLLEGERLRLAKEKRLLENERQSLEKQESALREERERWEKARDEQNIPQGAFWEVLWPAWDCRAYGRREYWGILRNIPAGRSEMDACMNMPAEIRGVTIRRPYRCQYVDGSIHGFWMVDWDQPDCRPWYQSFDDRGCTNWGSGLRRIEAELVGINDKGGQDWRLLCETTPMIWNHITYTSPAHCEDRWGKKIAAWDVPDNSC